MVKTRRVTARAKFAREEYQMADIETEVLIIGSGPAGLTTAAHLSTMGIQNVVVNRYRWLANTPRAHITNQRAMEVFRDLGEDLEAECYLYATHQDLMGENVFCVSLAGEELGRMKSWGNAPHSRAEHQLTSPCRMNDLPQTLLEPLLMKTACARGTQTRMSVEYLHHVQDAESVTATCLDKLTGKEFTIRAKYLVGADGGNSLVAQNESFPYEGTMGVGGSMNILFRADLSKYVARRPSVLYWIMQPGADVGGIGMGLVRMVRPWNEWLIVWGYDINQPAPEVDQAFATAVARQLVGDPALEIDLIRANTWTVNNCYAAELRKGRVFIMGDAAHRHPPSNGLGSNTSVQDSFNLAWKLAMVLKGQAGDGLLDTYSDERAPVAKQIVTRANKSIAEFGPIFGALGMDGGVDTDKIRANMAKLGDATPEAEAQRKALREAIAFKKYEFDAHGVEMNQRYRSAAIRPDGQQEPAFEKDAELHAQLTTWPGSRLPHAWVYDSEGRKHSVLDLCGHGRFTILTGIGGGAWAKAADAAGKALGIEIAVHVIGPGRDFQDLGGEWARVSEISDSGAILVRPDHHVCWRRPSVTANSGDELVAAMTAILSR
jgi:2,4-dichlorophenol 6-monooxygenase